MGMKIGQSAAHEARAGDKSATSLAGAKASRRGGDPGAFAALLKDAPTKDASLKDAPLKDASMKEGEFKDAFLNDESLELAGEQDARLEGDYYERAVEQGAVQRGDKGWGDAGVQVRGGAQNGEEAQGARAGSEEGREGGEVKGKEDAAVVVEEGFQPERGVGEVGEAKSEEVGQGPAELGEIVEAMVKAAQVGEDAQGRKVMFLELDVPGRGTLRVRLLKEHDGYAVRMRASDEGLARELLSSQSEMVRGAGARGVRLNAVEIVT